VSGSFLINPTHSICRLTRWCRTRFEINDVEEANIYCETNDCEVENPETATNEECKQGEVNAHEQEVTRTSRGSRSGDTFFTWKLPRKLRFSYSTIPNRPVAKRQPNPFASPTPPPLRPRTMSMVDNRPSLGMSPIMEETVQTRAMKSMPSLETGETEEGSQEKDEQDLGRDGDEQDPEREREWEGEYDEHLSSSRVTINPPHPPWDDNSLPDQPYQNPYYVLPIKDALWLPMNPIGTLDLDMTVTMTVSLTSEPGAGRLGPLTDMVTTIGSVLSGLTADLESAISLSGDEMSVTGLALAGTEEIELTPTIASRVQNLRSDSDVTTTDQQSDFLRTARPRPRTSGSATSQSRRLGPDLLTGSITRLPLNSSPQNSPSVGPTSPGDGLSISPSLLTGSLRSMSVSNGPLLGTADRRTYPKYTSMEEVTRSATQRPPLSPQQRHLSLRNMNSTNSIGRYSFLPLPPPPSGSHFAQRSMTSHVSAQSVAIQEALNEETEVLQQSHIQLQEEAEKQNAPRSWLTSWAFRNAEQ